MAMNEWKNIHSMLYKADTPRLLSTMQNICFLLSISAVTLKLMVKITSIQTTFQQAGICIQCIPRDLAESSRRENAHLFVNPILKLTIVLIWKTPPCLNFGKTSNRAVTNLPQYEQRTMHVLIRISSHRTSGSVCFFGNDRSSHSRIRINLDPMCVYYEWASD